MPASTLFDGVVRPGARRLSRSRSELGAETYYVYERMLGDPPRRCLVFESQQRIRCVSRYPAHWISLDDDALWALAERR